MKDQAQLIKELFPTRESVRVALDVILAYNNMPKYGTLRDAQNIKQVDTISRLELGMRTIFIRHRFPDLIHSGSEFVDMFIEWYIKIPEDKRAALTITELL